MALINYGLGDCTRSIEEAPRNAPVVHNPVGCMCTCARERFVGFRSSSVLRVPLVSPPSLEVLL